MYIADLIVLALVIYALCIVYSHLEEVKYGRENLLLQ